MSSEFCVSIKRKRARAVVRLTKDAGNILLVNDKAPEEYFFYKFDLQMFMEPFVVAGINLKDYTIKVSCKGGGMTGKSEAARTAVARILSKEDESYKTSLDALGLTTVCIKKKERKKYGMPGARKKAQHSKR